MTYQTIPIKRNYLKESNGRSGVEKYNNQKEEFTRGAQ